MYVVRIGKVINLISSLNLIIEVARLVHVILDPACLPLRYLMLDLHLIFDILCMFLLFLKNLLHPLLMNLLPQNLFLLLLDFHALILQILIIRKTIHELILAGGRTCSVLRFPIVLKGLYFELHILEPFDFTLMNL